MRVAFTGYYGMQNFGDDLFGAVCATAARSFWGFDPLLVSPPPPGSDCDSATSPGYLSRSYGSRGPLGKGVRLYSFAKAVVRSDIMVIGGGSVLTRSSIRKAMMLLGKNARGLRLAAMGVSIGPFPNVASESAAARIMDQLEYLSVRDERSYAEAARMGFASRTHQGRDLAGLLVRFAPGDPESQSAPDDRIRIGIAPCNYPASDDAPEGEKTLLALLQAIERMTARGIRYEVYVFSLNEHSVHGDCDLADNMQSRLQRMNVGSRRVHYGMKSPFCMAKEIGRCDAFVSARLHGGIAAYMQSVPFTIIEYHRKCRDFADDIGLPTSRRISLERCDADAFEEALLSMIRGGESATLPPGTYESQAADVFLAAPWARPQADRTRAAARLL